MTKNQIKRLPKLIEDGKNEREIAKIFGCHRNTIGYWVKRLRNEGVKLTIKKGAPFKKL